MRTLRVWPRCTDKETSMNGFLREARHSPPRHWENNPEGDAVAATPITGPACKPRDAE